MQTGAYILRSAYSVGYSKAQPAASACANRSVNFTHLFSAGYSKRIKPDFDETLLKRFVSIFRNDYKWNYDTNTCECLLIWANAKRLESFSCCIRQKIHDHLLAHALRLRIRDQDTKIFSRSRRTQLPFLSKETLATAALPNNDLRSRNAPEMH